jgi:O-antigen/teichoic acid export membrane protein
MAGASATRALRLGWGLADQAVSSLTNFAVVLLAIRDVGSAQFGAFSLAYVTYGFVLSASRGLVTAPLQVRFSGADLLPWRRAVAQCTGAAAVGGLAAGCGALAVAVLLNGTARGAFTALGLMLPGLLLQDSWRYSFFALGRGSQAFLNDSIWAIALIAALGLLRATRHQAVFWFILAWGTAAAIAAAAGAIQAGVLPRPAQAWQWVRAHRDLGFRYLAESMSINGASQLRTYAVGIIVGLTAIGYLQAANTLMGPFMVIYLGMTLVTVPEAVRAMRTSLRHLRLFCLVAGLGLALMCLAWGAMLLAALPWGLGNWLLGPIWRPAYPLILPLTLSIMGGCIDSGATSGLHAMGAARRSLRAGVVSSALYLSLTVTGTFIAGVLGTAWGLAIGTWIGALVWWGQLHAAMLESSLAAGGSPAVRSVRCASRLTRHPAASRTASRGAAGSRRRRTAGSSLSPGRPAAGRTCRTGTHTSPKGQRRCSLTTRCCPVPGTCPAGFPGAVSRRSGWTTDRPCSRDPRTGSRSGKHCSSWRWRRSGN